MVDWASTLAGVAIGGVITVIGVVITILWSKKASNRRKLLLWTMSQSGVVGGFDQNIPGLEGLELRYKGSAIPAASVARLTIWNEGTQSIPNSALTAAKPLRIVLPEGARAVDARVVECTDGAVDVQVSPNDSEFTAERSLTFQYLNAGHGFVVQVIHTGPSEKGPGISGVLEDVEGPTYVYPVRRWVQQGGIFFIGIVAAFIVSVFWQPFPKGSTPETFVFVGVILLGMIVFPVTVYRLFPNILYRPPGKLGGYAAPPIPLPRRR